MLTAKRVNASFIFVLIVTPDRDRCDLLEWPDSDIPKGQHAGMVAVADGSELAAQKLERVLTTDPGMGVVRHVDAGYERAIEVARERGVRVPMLDRES